MLRRFAALAALATMVVGPPLLLRAVGAYDWTGVNPWSPSDVRLLLLVMTALGWIVWGLWLASLATEALALASRGRLRVRVPLLGAGQALAAALLAAAIASAPAVTAVSAVAPLVAVTSTAAPDAAPRPQRPAPVDGVDELGGVGVVEAEALVAPLGRAPLVHPVAVGDDLWSLAERYYGDGTQWRRIVEANPDLAGDPLGELPAGSLLRVVEPVQVVTVRAGDTLWGLAERHLGDPNRWPEIFELNRARITDPDLIRAGWSLNVPVVSALASTQARTDTPAAPDVPPEEVDSGEAAAESLEPAPVVTAPDAADPPSAQGDRGPLEKAAALVADAAPLAAIVGGLSALTASAVLGGLGAWRRLQEASRPLGRRYVQPGDDLLRVETALALRGAAAARPAAPDRQHLVGRAMRHLSAHWLAGGVPAPQLERVVVGEVDVEFVLVDDQPDAPAGFQHRGRRIAASWTRLADLDDPDFPVAYPALVTLGADEQGDLHLVDLLAAGVLGLDGPGVDGPVTDALSAMLVELACAPWASELGLLVVTADPTFARAVSSDAVGCAATVEEGIATLERLAVERGRRLASPDHYDTARLSPDLAAAWAPQVVLFESAPDAPGVARLRAAVGGARCGIAAVLAVPAGSGTATWRLDGSDAVRGTLEVSPGPGAPTPRLTPRPTMPAQTLVAQTLPAPTREAIASLFRLAQATETHPAPWWAGAVPVSAPAPAAPAVEPAQEPVDDILTPRGPVLRLLGPVTLEGATGEPPARAARQCLEYCGWLLDHPGATSTQMAAELLVAEGTRRSNMSRLRTWLGSDAAGTPYLPDAYSGRIHLHDAVTSDWEQFRRLLLGGVDRAPTERLVAALELVRGAPLADAAPGQWHWAEELRSDMVALVRDAGVVLAARARAERDLELARWAAHRALAAAPDDELLLGERLRTEYAAGRLDEVDRLATRLQRTARTLGLDLLPETVDLLQELMEGRVRARRA